MGQPTVVVYLGRLCAQLDKSSTQVMAAKLSPPSLRLSPDNRTLFLLDCIFWAGGDGRGGVGLDCCSSI